MITPANEGAISARSPATSDPISLRDQVPAWVARALFDYSKARQRTCLLDLDDRLLDDVGVTREQAEIEARKGYWP